MKKFGSLLGALAAAFLSSSAQARTDAFDQSLTSKPSTSIAPSGATSEIIKEKLRSPQTLAGDKTFAKGPTQFSKSGGAFSKFGNKVQNRPSIETPDVKSAFDEQKPA